MVLLDDRGVADRDSAFAAIVDAMAAAGAIPPALAGRAVEAMIDRAELGPTAIGEGVAIPHAWCRGLERTVAALGVSRKGLGGYESLDGEPVHLVLAILTPPERSAEAAKQALFDAWLGRLRDPAFREAVRLSGTADDVRRRLRDADAAS
ncbi:PTS system fructose-specific EIIABC component [Aquisphaera giovannonii]|uniref:PTS system fructose-specific EIIABC component n=1 Tax=Aquisphaera giovannonii TaxID=406548 RepID=A0A5B9VX46_9BACT|nr:PTS system fructose-specific EIIABC component [Aquisphaera giovannonii]